MSFPRYFIRANGCLFEGDVIDYVARYNSPDSWTGVHAFGDGKTSSPSHITIYIAEQWVALGDWKEITASEASEILKGRKG